MKKTLCLSILLCIAFYTATGQYHHENNSETFPHWVQLLYSPNPDPQEVIVAYESYYQSHDFVKNGHTQFFKRWLKSLQQNSPLPSKFSQTNDLSSSQKTFASTTANWKCIGPFDYDEDAGGMSYAAGTAHIYTVEQSISNTNTLYAGTAKAGLWKSTDKGLSWELKTKDMYLNSVYAIEIDPVNENIVYMGAADGRLWKSTTGGDTWTPLSTNIFYNQRVQDIVLHPSDNTILFVLTKGGFYRSTNSGASFTLIDNGEYQEIEFHPTDAATVYTIKYNSTTTRTEFYKSTDNGQTFTLKSSGWPSTGEQKRTEIAVTDDAPNKVYAYCTGAVNGGSGTYGLYMSTNSGESFSFNCCGPQPGGAASSSNPNLMAWSDQGTDDGGQFYYDVAFGVMPDDDQKVFVGGVNLWHSSDGGSSFTCPSKWSHSYKSQYVHADLHDIKIYGNDIWIACDGGIWYSNDKGVTFEKRFKGIAGTDLWGFGVGYGEKGRRVIVGGAYHNGTQLMDNDVYNGGWAVIHGGDGVGGHVSPVDDRVVHTQNGAQRLPGDRTQNVMALNFTKKPNNDYQLGKASAVIYHPQVYNTIFVGEGTSLWKSTNDGLSFTEVHDFGEHVADLEISPINPEVMTVATYIDYWGKKKLFRTTDGGINWTEITLPSALDIKTAAPYDVTLSSTNENELWIAKLAHYGSFSYQLNGYKVFHSTDGGSTWTNLTTSLLDDEKVHSILHQAGTNGAIYIGTDYTVYYRNNDMTEWVAFNEGLPAQTPCTKLLPDYWGGKILNGSTRSVYESDFYEDVAPIARFSVDQQSTTCATGKIQFIDQSTCKNDNLVRTWSFEGGIPATTSEQNPQVTYPLPGNYKVTLTITDVNGSHTITRNSFINITGSCTTSLDLEASSLLNTPLVYNCENQSFSPSLVVTNYGTEDITSYQIEVYTNGNLANTLTENTTLASGENTTLSLGSITNATSLEVKITSINGGQTESNTDNNSITIQATGDEIDPTTISVIEVSDEYGSDGGNNTLDNNASTIWHDNWPVGTPMPHYLTYDLGESHVITDVRLLNRQNNSNGYLKNVNVYISDDINNWGTAQAIAFASTNNWQIINLDGTEGRYIKFEITSNQYGTSIASIAELRFGSCNATPDPIPNFTVSDASPFSCENITYSSTSSGNTSAYLWDFGIGATPATATGVGPHTVAYSSTGTKSVSLTLNNTVTETKTNFITVSQNPTITPKVTIETAQTTICEGEDIIASIATASHTGASGYYYQWRLNNTIVENNSSATSHSYSSLSNGDELSVTLVSTAECRTKNDDLSNTIEIQVTPSIIPAISISTSTTIGCEGSLQPLVASHTGGTVNWYHNTSLIGTGNTINFEVPSATASVFATLTSDASCATQNEVNSNTLPLQSEALVTPVVNIESSTPLPICKNQSILFSIAYTQHAGNSPSYQWYVNNVLTSSGSSFSSSILENNDVVSAILVSNEMCTTTPNATSNEIEVDIETCTSLEKTVWKETKVYPNPTSGWLHIKASVESNSNIHVRILNSLGQIVYQSNADLFHEMIDMSRFAKGNYVVELISGQSIKRMTFLYQ